MAKPLSLIGKPFHPKSYSAYMGSSRRAAWEKAEHSMTHPPWVEGEKETTALARCSVHLAVGCSEKPNRMFGSSGIRTI